MKKISSIHAIGNMPFAEVTKCWKCDTVLDRTIHEPDGVYGVECPKCGESLRNHRTYGEGKEKDLFEWHKNKELY